MHHDGVDAVLEAAHRRRAGRGDGEDAAHLELQVGRRARLARVASARRARRALRSGLGASWPRRASSRASRPAWPSARTATVSTTGQPSSAASLSTSICSPSARATSAMLRATISGRPSCVELEHEAQVHAQVGRVDDGDDRVGRRLAVAPALDHLERDLLVGRRRGQAVGAGQVDDRDRAAVLQPGQADLALDRHAGVVGDLLARAGEQVEEGGLAAVRVADQRDAPERRLVRGVQGVVTALASAAAAQPRPARASMACASDLDALRLEQAQGEHRLADQHGERLAPARAAAQQLHRLAGQEAELAEPAQGDRVDLRRGRDDAGDGRPVAGGERGAAHRVAERAHGRAGRGAGRTRECK